MGREIQAIRETRERYMAGEDPLRRSMSEREGSLMAELARQEAQNYSQVRIYTMGGVLRRPFWAFGGEDAGSWVDSIVAHLFEAEYPSLPFDHNSLPGTLTHERAEEVFRGIVQGDPAAAETDSAFEPPFGLSSSELLGVFDTSNSRIMDIIAKIMASKNGEMPAGALLDMLCRDHGLNYTLATLYLLAFVRRSESGVRLAPLHRVRARQGEPFVSDWITRDLMDDIRFSDSIAGEMELVSARPAPTWNMALLYASMLVDGLERADGDAEVAVQQTRMVAGLEETGLRVAESRKRLEGLVDELDGAGDLALSELVDGLQSLCSTGDFRSLYATAVDRFGRPAALGEAREDGARNIRDTDLCRRDGLWAGAPRPLGPTRPRGRQDWTEQPACRPLCLAQRAGKLQGPAEGVRRRLPPPPQAVPPRVVSTRHRAGPRQGPPCSPGEVQRSPGIRHPPRAGSTGAVPGRNGCLEVVFSRRGRRDAGGDALLRKLHAASRRFASTASGGGRDRRHRDGHARVQSPAKLQCGPQGSGKPQQGADGKADGPDPGEQYFEPVQRPGRRGTRFLRSLVSQP